MGFQCFIDSSIFIPWCHMMSQVWLDSPADPAAGPGVSSTLEGTSDWFGMSWLRFVWCMPPYCRWDHDSTWISWFDVHILIVIDLPKSWNHAKMIKWFHGERASWDAWDLVMTRINYQQLDSQISAMIKLPRHMSSNATSDNRDQDVLHDGSYWYLPSLGSALL